MQSLFMGATLVAGRAMPSQPQSSLLEKMFKGADLDAAGLQVCLDKHAAVTEAKTAAKDGAEEKKKALDTLCKEEGTAKCINAKAKAEAKIEGKTATDWDAAIKAITDACPPKEAAEKGSSGC